MNWPVSVFMKRQVIYKLQLTSNLEIKYLLHKGLNELCLVTKKDIVIFLFVAAFTELEFLNAEPLLSPVVGQYGWIQGGQAE